MRTWGLMDHLCVGKSIMVQTISLLYLTMPIHSLVLPDSILSDNESGNTSFGFHYWADFDWEREKKISSHNWIVLQAISSTLKHSDCVDDYIIVTLHHKARQNNLIGLGDLFQWRNSTSKLLWAGDVQGGFQSELHCHWFNSLCMSVSSHSQTQSFQTYISSYS